MEGREGGAGWCRDWLLAECSSSSSSSSSSAWVGGWTVTVESEIGLESKHLTG